MDLLHLQEVRGAEIEQVLGLVVPRLHEGAGVLEIGAGSGWQSKVLAERGFDVVAVDVEGSEYLGNAVFPVRAYDGRSLPFPDSSFDLVFSSNVLEHVSHIDMLLREIRRVLKGGAYAIHLLPTPTWRLWSALGFYCYPTALLYARLRSAVRSEPRIPPEGGKPGCSSIGLGRKIWNLAVPPRHGEVGNVFTEVFHFSQFRWREAFGKAGFESIELYPNRLFYTGGSVLGDRLSLSARRRVSYVLGSSCIIYMMRNPL